MPNHDFWRERRVLIVGHTGFKGAWAWAWLERMGADIYGLSLVPEPGPNLAHILGVIDKPNSFIGDIRNQADIDRVIAVARPQIVLHMAAQALVRRSYREPLETFDTNVIGTLNVLEALRGCEELEACIVVTSDKVYENNGQGRAFVEEDPLGGADPYSASKAAAEIATASFARSFFAHRTARVATARAGNVIGGGDWSEDRILPDLWRAQQMGNPVTLRYPHATRPWQHVLEPIAGYLRFAEALCDGLDERALNFGPIDDDHVSVQQVVESFQASYADGRTASGWVLALGEHPKEAPTLAINARRACSKLGWRPRLATQEAIAWSAAWYAAFDRNADMDAFTRHQIRAYEGYLE